MALAYNVQVFYISEIEVAYRVVMPVSNKYLEYGFALCGLRYINGR